MNGISSEILELDWISFKSAAGCRGYHDFDIAIARIPHAESYGYILLLPVHSNCLIFNMGIFNF